jgi:hypothetical protein
MGGYTNGIIASRNVADASNYPTLTATVANASSVSDILDLKNSGGVVAKVDVNGNFTAPTVTMPAASSATDSASLGSELTTSGTCSGTGWTGTYPNYVAPGTTAPLTCTGFSSGTYYQTVTGISGNSGAGTVTVAIGTAQTAVSSSAASSTLTFGPKANGTSLTYTPTAAFNGTIAISAKLISPITTYSLVGKDSTGAVSSQRLMQTLAGSYNDFGNFSGAYCTTCVRNTSTGYQGQYVLTTGSYNTNSGYEGQYALTIGSSNTNSGYEGQYALTIGSSNTNSGFAGQYSLTTGSYNTNSGYEGQYSLTTGSYNFSGGFNAGRYITGGSTGNTTPTGGIYLGSGTQAYADGQTNETVIGYNAVGNGTNTVTIGNSSVTADFAAGIQAHPTQSVVSSATTIAPTAQVFHVSGTTTIQTITAPVACTTTGYACQLTLIPDGIWATNTSGNIALASTAVVSKALIMTYDPATTKWYPSY